MKNFLQTRIENPTEKGLDEIRYEEHRVKAIIGEMLHNNPSFDMLKIEQEEQWLVQVKKAKEELARILSNNELKK